MTVSLERLPAEFWELSELVMSGCPGPALAAFRKSVIGRGKPLTAKQADAAIGGATTALAGTIEPMHAKLLRLRWMARHRFPVVFAREQEYVYTDDELDTIVWCEKWPESQIIYLEFDSDAVDRVSGPGLTGRSG